MIERSTKRISMRALVVDDELTLPTAEGRAARALEKELQNREIEVVEAASAEDGVSVMVSDSAIHAILVDWTLGDANGKGNGRGAHDHTGAKNLLKLIRSRNGKIPIFLMAERGEASSIPIDVMEMVDEYIWTLEDTAAFVGGRVVAAIRRYMDVMLPPLAAALMKFSQEYEYSWHTPGAHRRHRVPQVAGGADLLRLLRREPAAVRPLDQRRRAGIAARPHRADRRAREVRAPRSSAPIAPTSVTNGTSMSNRVIFMAAVARDQIALCDRNCHKSIEHSLVMSGGIPTYLVPLRNRYGIIGPIPPERLKAAALKAAIKANPLVPKGVETRAGVLGHHQLHLRRALLQRPAGGGAARPDRRSDSLRRGLVRLRAVQSDLPGPPRDARRPEGPQGADGLRDALDAQAARGALPGLAAPHPRRPQPDPACAVQRIVHDAGVHLAALHRSSSPTTSRRR